MYNNHGSQDELKWPIPSLKTGAQCKSWDWGQRGDAAQPLESKLPSWESPLQPMRPQMPAKSLPKHLRSGESGCALHDTSESHVFSALVQNKQPV
jgi:hypothetical protein